MTLQEKKQYFYNLHDIEVNQPILKADQERIERLENTTKN